MKPSESKRSHFEHLALVLAATAGLATGSAQALTTTATYNLDNGGSGTSIDAEEVLSPAWIPAGTLPVGSILRSVTIDATLDTDGDSITFANDLFVYVDPGVPDSGGEVLQVGGFDALGNPPTLLEWANGGSDAPGTTCMDTKTAPAHFPDDIDLNGVGVYIGSRGLKLATWSGEVTVEYDVFVPATIVSFGPGAVIGELSGNAADIAWTVPLGTDVTALAPTFTLSSGASDKPSGSTQDFTNPVVYTITDGGNVNVYTVTVTAANAVLWNVAGDGDWDLTTVNWLTEPGAAATTFANGNEAIFGNAAGGTITIASGIEPLATTVSAASGTYIFDGELATGSLTKDGAGILQVYGLVPNPYSGGTIINDGTLHLGVVFPPPVGSPDVIDPVGTGTVTLNNGTLYLSRVQVSNDLIVNGGSIYQQNGWGATWSGPITLNATTNFDTFYTLNISGDIGGTGGLTKTLNGPLNLSGTNSYTGPTSVTAGTMQCDNPDALGSGDLNISSGNARLNLNFTGTKAVASVTLDGVPQTAPGTYGSLTSDANFKSAFFDGTGTVSTGDPATAAYMISFGTNVSGSTAVIDPVSGNAAAISWVVPSGTNLATLAPDFVLTAGATCTDQTSGALPTPGFDAGPVDYTVVSQDSSVTNVYTVTVTVLPVESTLIWDLGSGGDWDLTTSNWLGQSSGLPTPYFDGVNVIFDNTAGGTIDIDADMSPLSTTVSAASGTYFFTGGPIATGSLVKDGGGTLRIQENNTYDGGTTINAGTLRVDFPAETSGLGTGPVILNDGTFFLWRVTVDNSLTINGGLVDSWNGFGNRWNGPITLNADFNCHTQYWMACSNTISGVGGVNKNGPEKLTFSGTNTYTGATSVTAGTLQCDSANSLGGGDLNISSGGAKVNLNYSGTKSIAALTLDGVAQTADGTYGSSASGATYQSAYFEGTGTVTLGGSAYDSWAAGPFLGTLDDPTSTVDFDLGGLATGIEWVVNGDPTDPTDDASIAPTGTIDSTGTYLVFTYQRSNAADADANTAIKVEYDTDLQGPWTDADGAPGVLVEVTKGSPTDTVEVKIPLSLAAPGTQLFARLNVVVTIP